MRKRICFAVVVFAVVAAPTSAYACGGLIGPRGAVNLTRTTTLAAHHNQVEHYVTAFKYSGGGGQFGSIVPLPAMPSKVEKGGDWTLQRLQQETSPQVFAAATSRSAAEGDAKEVYKTRIDALDITVVKGGGAAVGRWAAAHGFRLPPDAPEVLDFYAKRSPFFMAAVFDSKAAEKRGQEIGDGTPIHVTMPLRSPWVPLRILGLGKQASEPIDADVYLLTDRVPNLLPKAGTGYEIERQVPASRQLLADLRSDRGMGWLPTSGMTLTHLVVASKAPQLRYDLAINVNGGAPSRIRAGLAPLATARPTAHPTLAPTPASTPDVEPPLAAPAGTARSPWPIATAVIIVAVAGALAAYLALRKSRA